jgi:hypothetical protein
LNVSEQLAERISAESGSLNAEPMGPHLPDAKSDPVAASASEMTSVESPDLAPGQGEAVEPPKAEAPKMGLPRAGEFKVEGPKADDVKPDVPKPDAPKIDTAKPDASRTAGKIMIMSAGDRGWDSHDADPEPESKPGSDMFGKRRFSALAAVVALAAIAGALGGALATAGLEHFAGGDTAAAATTGNQALAASVARIDADILALKAGAEHTSKVGITQFKQTNERLDKVEKAQAEPAAKLAKLSEAVEKLHATPPAASAPVPAAAPVAAKEVTGSVSVPTVSPPKVELARLPTVDHWVLRDVANGGALIEGRQGIFEVYAGDPVPGLGRVDAIRRQDGRWVVVTSKGLIVAR